MQPPAAPSAGRLPIVARHHRRVDALAIVQAYVGRREAFVGCSLAAGVLVLATVRAGADPVNYDIGLAYAGGVIAWSTGHPETLTTWIGTPFLGMTMAVISRVVSASHAALALDTVNGAALIAMVSVMWTRLRRTLPRWLWWGTLAAAALFAPALSNLWWKQLNIVSFGLVLCAWWILQRQGRWTAAGPFLIALSILLKPVAIFVPVALFFWRDTRRAAFATAAWALAMVMASQAFLAWRAGSLAALSPVPALTNFAGKAPPASGWVCVAENFSPASMLCRLGGFSLPALQRVAVVVAVVFLAWLAYRTVRHDTGWSWRVFAYACALSPLISPIAWSHYQLLLAPLLLVLVTDLHRLTASATMWGSLALGFVLTELVWQPYGTLPGHVIRILGGAPEAAPGRRAVFAIAEFAQYVVLSTALVYFSAQRAPHTAMLVGHDERAIQRDGESIRAVASEAR